MFGAPRVPHDFVPRPTLRSRFDSQAALVVVRAPAGCGKTAAVADWAASSAQAGAGAWLTVRGDAVSRVGFWRSVIELLSDADLLPADSVLARSTNSLEDVGDLVALLRRGLAQVRQPYVLVLDDAHLIADDLVFRDLVEVVASGSLLRVIVLTRTVGHLESEPVRLAVSPDVLQAGELAFSVAETAAGLAIAGVPAGDDGFADMLCAAVGGNPLLTRGVILALQRGDVTPDARAIGDSLAGPRATFLREAVIAHATADFEVEFALRCSVPDVLTPELAQALSRRDDAATLLESIEAAGLGMWSDDHSGVVFTLSPVYRSALRAELESRMPSELPRLHTTSAEWALDRRDFTVALRHALAAGEHALVSEIVLQGWNRMPGSPSEFAEQIGQTSLRTLHRVPLLAMLIALKYNATGTHRMRAIELFGVAAASARLRGKRDPMPQRLVLAVVESAALRIVGRIDAALGAADRGMGLREQLSVEHRDELAELMPTLLNQAGQTYLYAGDRARAMALFHEAAAYPRALSERGWFHGLSLAAGVSAIEGEMDEAARLTDIARGETWPEGWRDGYIGSMYQVAEAYRAIEAFDFGGAHRHLDTLAPHADTIEHWPILLQARVLAQLGEGRTADALLALEVEPQRHSRALLPSTRLLLDATRALVLLASGRAQDAEAALARHPRTSPIAALGRARIALVLGRADDALVLLAPVFAARRGVPARLRADALLVQAAAAARLGRTEFVLETLDVTAVLLRDRRLRLPLMLIPRHDLEALSRMVDAAGAPIASELFDDLDAVPDVLPRSLASVVLTSRERVVLGHLESTSNVAEIAEALFVSTNTVKSQLRSIYRKLGVSSREQALVVASELRLLEHSS